MVEILRHFNIISISPEDWALFGLQYTRVSWLGEEFIILIIKHETFLLHWVFTRPSILANLKLNTSYFLLRFILRKDKVRSFRWWRELALNLALTVLLSEKCNLRLEGILLNDLPSWGFVAALGFRLEVPRLMLKIYLEASLIFFLVEKAWWGFRTLRLLDNGLLKLSILFGKKQLLLVVFLLVLRDLLPFLSLALRLAFSPLTYRWESALLFLKGQWNLQMTLIHLNSVYLNNILLSLVKSQSQHRYLTDNSSSFFQVQRQRL